MSEIYEIWSQMMGCIAGYGLAVLVPIWVLTVCRGWLANRISEAFYVWRRLPLLFKFALPLFVGALFVYGSTKTNAPPSRILRLVREETVTADEIAKGYRLVSEETVPSAAVVPATAVAKGNWGKRGALQDWFRLETDLAFPLGTNRISVWSVFTGAAIRPTPRDVAHEITAVGSPMLAIPGVSEFLYGVVEDGSQILTWRDFFVNADTNQAVTAQITLGCDGSFVTQSNDVRRTYARVNPADWDGDGRPNTVDENPTVCDGDFFGPENLLPEDCNSNAYCMVTVAAREVDAEVTFVGDGPSNYPDPHFMIRAGETNDVFILIGKRYDVTSDEPIEIVGASDLAVDVVRFDDRHAEVHYPVSISAQELQLRRMAAQDDVITPSSCSASFTMSVWPSNLGGAFTWSTGVCCPIAGSGMFFHYDGGTSCNCTGCSAAGTYNYEGYSICVSAPVCGCSSEKPVYQEDEEENPSVAGFSVSFSNAAVIFEKAHLESPGVTAPRRSTTTHLSVVAHGGEYGGNFTVQATGLDKIQQTSVRTLPTRSVYVPAGASATYDIEYEGLEPSASEGDITVSGTFVSDDFLNTQYQSSDSLTSIELELQAVYTAAGNACVNRHTLGVGEEVRFVTRPESLTVERREHQPVLFDSAGYYASFRASSPDVYVCPLTATTSSRPSVRCGDVEYFPEMTFLEPSSIECREAGLMTGPGYPCLQVGDVGGAVMSLRTYVGPMNVSFHGILMAEIPCDDPIPPSGYFTNYTGHLTHSHPYSSDYEHLTCAVRIAEDNYWTVDHAGFNGIYPNWSAGSLTWKIPIGWFPRPPGGAERVLLESVAHENVLDDTSRAMLVGGSTPSYLQVFTIDEDGVCGVQKHGCSLRRTPQCRITLVDRNGERVVQWSHQGN